MIEEGSGGNPVLVEKVGAPYNSHGSINSNNRNSNNRTGRYASRNSQNASVNSNGGRPSARYTGTASEPVGKGHGDGAPPASGHVPQKPKSSYPSTSRWGKKKKNLDEPTPSSDVRASKYGARVGDRGPGWKKKFNGGMVNRFLNDSGDDGFGGSTFRRSMKRFKGGGSERVERERISRVVDIPESITISDLSNRMGVRASEVVKYLMNTGVLATVNQNVDSDTAELVCLEFGHSPNRRSDSEADSSVEVGYVHDELDCVSRGPIVAVMGHVDHGKTTLLDSLRLTNVATKEAGSITQHISAYSVRPDGTAGFITFVDTPGHAAFSELRSRGANVTDIILLVVAADDGVKEQTIESISFAKKSGIPIIVVINKIDKTDLKIDRLKTELLELGIVLEEYGGDVLSCCVSAAKKIGLPELLETILLQSEVLQLKANANRKASGVVLESRIDKRRGIVVHCIVQNGVLHNGDFLIAGSTYGKVRSMFDDSGRKLSFAGPSSPVEIIGFGSIPNPGDVFAVVDSEQKAKEISECRVSRKKRESSAVTRNSGNVFLNKNDRKIVRLLIKVDVSGSLDAVCSSILNLKHDDVMVVISDKGVGPVSDSDVDFASNTDSVIMCFNVNASQMVRNFARTNSVDIRIHSVIYRIVDDVKSLMSAVLSPIIEEVYSGRAEVRKVFFISRLGVIAGCYVTDGIVKRSDSKIKVLRNGRVIFEGTIKSMKQGQLEAKESKQSCECGILAHGYTPEEGDIIESFLIVENERVVD
jgi:translation initiation factor IF-2